MSKFKKIWLIDTGEAVRVWCDSPDPSIDIDPSDVTGPYILDADKRIAELEAENKQLRKRIEVQSLNLRLRTIDGSMDEDALVKEAGRYRLAKKHNPWALIQIAWGISTKANNYSVAQVDEAFDVAMEEE